MKSNTQDMSGEQTQDEEDGGEENGNRNSNDELGGAVAMKRLWISSRGRRHDAG